MNWEISKKECQDAKNYKKSFFIQTNFKVPNDIEYQNSGA